MDKAELHKHFYTKVADMLDEAFEERPSFIMLIPDNGILICSVEPQLAALCLSNCVSSLLASSFHPTVIASEDELGNVTAKKVDMN